VSPGSTTIQNAVDSHGTGTTFCITDGVYNISSPVTVKSGDTFIGVFTDGTPPIVDGGHRTGVKWIFDAHKASSVAFQDLQIANAFGPGKKIDKQAGRGIWGGQGFTIDHVHLFGNQQSGVGGGWTGTVSNSEVNNNGSVGYLSCCSGGVKSAQSITVHDSYVHDNTGDGIWANHCTPQLTVYNNTIVHNTRDGVTWETSTTCSNARAASIHDNIIQNNNSEQRNGNGGVTIRNSPNADVAFNTFGGNFNAAVKVTGSHDISGEKIHNNTLNGDEINGCDRTGVSCFNNLP
jgi:hypothetical protein